MAVQNGDAAYLLAAVRLSKKGKLKIVEVGCFSEMSPTVVERRIWLPIMSWPGRGHLGYAQAKLAMADVVADHAYHCPLWREIARRWWEGGMADWYHDLDQPPVALKKLARAAGATHVV